MASNAKNGIRNEDSIDLEKLLEDTVFSDDFPRFSSVKGVTLPCLYPKIADSIENMKIWDDDVWICSFPKSGTTWTQEMVWCIVNDLDFKRAQTVLANRCPFLEQTACRDHSELVKKFPEYEKHYFMRNNVEYFENVSRPRFIKTHLPFNLLPRDLREGRTKAKIVYVCRNPKDVCISHYHYAKHFAFRGNFEQFCQLFLGDKGPYSPFCPHVLSYWTELNHPTANTNILFLRYEEMKSNLAAVIERTVEFLEKPTLSPKHLEQLVDHLSFESMKKNPAVNYESEFEFTKKLFGIAGDTEFMRKGEMNQWKSTMSPEMSEKFDKWISENLKSSDFSFDEFN